MIVVDSSVWIAHIRNSDQPEVRYLRGIEDRTEIIVGDVIMLEVLRGARDDLHARRLELELRKFTIVPMVDSRLATVAAKHYRQLRSMGTTIRNAIDLIIATFCIVHDHELLHSDRDFTPFARHLGLRLALPPA